MWYIMIILSRMCEYDMELLLLMMDHDNINNPFEFKSNWHIKYPGFLMILTNLLLPFIAIYEIQLNLTQFATGNIIHGTYDELSQ